MFFKSFFILLMLFALSITLVLPVYADSSCAASEFTVTKLVKGYNLSLLWVCNDSSSTTVGSGISTFLEGNNSEKALEEFNKAIEINLTSYPAWINKGVILSDLGRYDESVQAFDQAIKINPDNIMAYSDKGVVLGVQGKITDAIQVFTDALGIEPDNIILIKNIENAKKSSTDKSLASGEEQIKNSVTNRTSDKLNNTSSENQAENNDHTSKNTCDSCFPKQIDNNMILPLTKNDAESTIKTTILRGVNVGSDEFEIGESEEIEHDGVNYWIIPILKNGKEFATYTVIKTREATISSKCSRSCYNNSDFKTSGFENAVQNSSTNLNNLDTSISTDTSLGSNYRTEKSSLGMESGNKIVLVNHLLTFLLDNDHLDMPGYSKVTFTPEDKNIYSWVHYQNLDGKQSARYDWYSPLGDLYYSKNFSVGEPGKHYDNIYAYGSKLIEPEMISNKSLSGEWKVNAYLNDILQYSDKFSFSASSKSDPKIISSNSVPVDNIVKPKINEPSDQGSISSALPLSDYTPDYSGGATVHITNHISMDCTIVWTEIGSKVPIIVVSIPDGQTRVVTVPSGTDDMYVKADKQWYIAGSITLMSGEEYELTYYMSGSSGTGLTPISDSEAPIM